MKSLQNTNTGKIGKSVLFACLFSAAFLCLESGAAEPARKPDPVLTVELTPRFNTDTVQAGVMGQTNVAGQAFSVTRLDMILSEVAFHRNDGVWIEAPNWQAFLSLMEGRNRFEVKGIPPGRYDRMRFNVGLQPKLNHSDPAQYGPEHPLNPNLNGLHWGWQGGYVFLALEGHWNKPDGKSEGFSFHLGNDFMLTPVELPVSLDFSANRTIAADLYLNRLLGGLPALVFNGENSVTHSRKGDALALRLQSQLRGAFAISSAYVSGDALANTKTVSQRIVAKTATPYRFTFARQFPPPELPLDNPLTQEGVELGKRLFNDAQLSVNGMQACATCHQADQVFTDGKPYSPGAEGQKGVRNSMPLFNLAWKRTFFWDGRAPSLRAQVLMPIQNPIEMHESLTNVVAKLKASKLYPVLFERAFGTKEINADRVARALEQFLLTIVSYRSKFDRAMQGREKFTDQEKRGFELFVTEYDPYRGFYGADCFHCHGGPFFTNHGFANNGLDDKFSDVGLEKVTGRAMDRGRFAVPSLRNVALTAPYMHDGRFKTLEEVVEHYSTGVKRTDTLDPNISKHPDGGVPLSEADKKALVAFLKTLTDETYVPERGGASQQLSQAKTSPSGK